MVRPKSKVTQKYDGGTQKTALRKNIILICLVFKVHFFIFE